MKKNKYSILRWLIIAICALPLMSAGCEEGDDDTGGDSGSSALSNYLRVSNVRAHYVGKDVIVDYDLTNKSGKDLNDLVIDSSAFDEEGNEFIGNVAGSTGEGHPWDSRLSNISIGKNETRKMRIKITAPRNILKNVNLKINGGSNTLGVLYDSAIKFSTTVSDSRKSSDAVWTNDDRMSYSYPRCSRNGNDLLATIAITNKTGVDFSKLTIAFEEADDGNGRIFDSYIDGLSVSIDGTEEVWRTTCSILNNETRNVTFRIRDFYLRNPYCLNARIEVSSDNYTFASNAFYLTTIKIN